MKKCMEYRVEGRRPVGRPRKTWLDSVEADMAELEIDKEDVHDRRLQTTQPTSGGAVTAAKNCCANCVEPSRPQQWGPDLPFLGMPAMRTRWMAGAAAHKSG